MQQNKPRQQQRQKFTKNYIDCILKNQNYIAPTKSCDLGKSDEQNKKYGGNRTNNNQLLGRFKLKYEILNVGKINAIFAPSWKKEAGQEQDRDKKFQQQKIIDTFLKKNQQIANSLIKQKKSMSDFVYNTGQNDKMIRYSQQPNTKSIVNLQLKNKQSPEKQRSSLSHANILPKINIKHNAKSNAQKSIEYEQGQIIIVKDQKLSFYNNLISTQQGIQAPEPKYTQITNVNIKRFLKLKQHAYEAQQRNNILQQLASKKKKIQNHKKKMVKKQKDYKKNSLQEYLETKLAPTQQKYQSLRTSSKNQLLDSNKQPVEEQNKNEQQTKQAAQNSIQPQRRNDKAHQSVQKSKKKIGLNAKISNRNIFQNADSQSTIYQQKIKMFRQFIFQINFVHRIFDPVIIGEQPVKNQNKFKYFVGKGNNRQLVKALMKRRFWWVETDDINEAHFVWTQLKVNSIFQIQQKNQRIAADFYEDIKQEAQIKSKKDVIKIKKSGLYKAPLPQNYLLKIMTANQYKEYMNFLRTMESINISPQRFQIFENRKKYLPQLKTNQAQKNLKVHNHFQFNFYIGNKKALYYNLKKYCQLTKKNLFDIVPLTFHVGQAGINDDAYKQFLKYYKMNKIKKDSKNIWIVKPGENSNRGNGISVFDELYQINKIITSANKNTNDKGPHTFIIQKYIEKPLLYKGRKFDIRHYMLATRIHGKMRLYFYGEGYVRTSSSDFDLQQIGDNQIHLTNDAIQKHAQNYGKYEQGNKISYTELQRYLDITYPNRKYSMTGQFYPKIKEIALQAFKSCYLSLDPNNLSHNFQIFGLDFMIDNNFQVWLIQINTNPCLELSSSILSRIIPTMLQHSLRLSLDPLFPPPCHYSNSIKHLVPDSPLDRLQYELIFDQGRDGSQLELLYGDRQGLAVQVEEDADTFDNDGKEIQLDIQ